MSKSIDERKAYVVHKSKQLDKVTSSKEYRRRAIRIMRYNNLLMEINNQKIKRIVEGEK